MCLNVLLGDAVYFSVEIMFNLLAVTAATLDCLFHIKLTSVNLMI